MALLLGLVAACGKSDGVGIQEEGETDGPAASERTVFTVELRHLGRYPYLASGLVPAPPGTDAGSAPVELALDVPLDGKLSLALSVPGVPDAFVGLSSFSPFDDAGDARTGTHSDALAWYELAAEDGGFLVRERAAPFAVAFELVHLGGTAFALAFSSDEGSLGAGVHVLHHGPAALFAAEQPASSGLVEMVLEGNPEPWLSALGEQTHAASILAPGLFVVHRDGEPLFTRGEADRGEGLEQLAEEGDAARLHAALEDRFDSVERYPDAQSTYADEEETLPIYSFLVLARPGDRLSLASMFAQSNDLFVGTAPEGLPLFRSGKPAQGDITALLELWDTGTEVNEAPGYGPNQAPRQAARGAGAEEQEPIEPVHDGFAYPPIDELVSVTLGVRE